ncbi:MAG TPA: hypothetical protein VMS78_11800 [Rhizomicrobium sp.]|nr:hypothetical protein [Rhizomicrobium sp.]
MAAEKGPHSIEIRVSELAELFDTLDPYPFRERDLDRRAEEFIVGWARELPREGAITIVVHAPQSELEGLHGKVLPDAIHRYFTSRENVTVLELKELFRVGRTSLAIGVVVLALCVLVGSTVSLYTGPGYIVRFVQESAIIVGWVANWRPIEIFLYEWWPIARRRNLYRRLADARVELKPSEKA